MKCHRQQSICLLLQAIFAVNCLAENLILDINFKKPIAITSDAFLSFTLDPATLQEYADAFTTNIERTTNIAQAMAPAYVRVGGPQSNFHLFEQASMQDETDAPFGIPMYQWTFAQWAQNVGLDVITCIAPRYMKSKIHSGNASSIIEVLSFADKMGLNINWQLGYECQTRYDLSGQKLGQYVAKLGEILKTTPRYHDSLITGPDIVACKTTRQQKYLQDYLNSANSALSAITWHPDFASVSLNNGSIFVNHENLDAEKNRIHKIISDTAGKKPLWIAESKPEDIKHRYLGALMWTRRLGDTAKLGVQVIMRQLTNLTTVPDYWVGLLHKTLVSRQVLETKFQFNNENYVHFYSQCTKPSRRYEKGAITIFGVNLTPREITANVKDLKIKTLHKYILSPDSETGNKMFSQKVLLNNKPLNLIDDKLPDLNPDVMIDSDDLKLELSSSEIGFWVIPDAKVEACIYPEEETEHVIVKKLSKQHDDISHQDNYEENNENIDQFNLKSQKTQTTEKELERRKQRNANNENNESEQKILNAKLLDKIKQYVQKKLHKKQKNNFSSRQRSMTIVFNEAHENSSEEDKQHNVGNRNFAKTEVDDFLKKLEDIRGTLRKYDSILLKRKDLLKSEYVGDFESEIQSIDNAETLIFKIDTLLQFDKEEVTLNKLDAREIIHKEILIKQAIKKLKKLLNDLENSQTRKSEIVIEKIEKYFDTFYNLLKENKLTKNDENNDIFVVEEGTRFKRDLNGKLGGFRKIKVLGKHSRINNLKNHMAKRKKNDDRREVITSDNPNNPIRNFHNDKSNFHNLFWRNPVKKFCKNDALVPHYPLSLQKHKRIKKDSTWKFSKLDGVQDYQSTTEESERMKRDINKKFVEIGLKRDNMFRKHLRTGDIRDHINERKLRRKDEFRKEGLLSPFNPRTDSGESNFYGFFRQDPIKGFPESDIFVTTGDSSEQNGKDYDYVEDEDDNGAKKQSTQKQVSTAEDDTWVECGEEGDYVPNEFFESVALLNPRVQGSAKNYGDIAEAESFLAESNDKKDNDNEMTINEVVQEQPPDEEKEKRAREETMKQLVNYYDDSEEREDDRDRSYKALELAFKQSSTPLDQLLKTQTYHQASNVQSGKTECFSGPAAAYVDYFMPDRILRNKRAKRSNWDKRQKIFAEEMTKVDEENTRDYDYRVVRASRNKPYYNRVKRAAQFTGSSGIESVSADIAQSEESVADFLTKEEYEQIMTGEVLPNTVVEDDITTKVEIANSNDELEREPSNVVETTDVASTSTLDNSRLNNISEQQHSTESIAETLPVDSELSAKEDDTVRREMFFRARPKNIQSEIETTTYDSPETISEISSENESVQEKFFVTENAQEAVREKTHDLIKKNGETDGSPIFPATIENQKKEKRHNNNDKARFKSTNSLEEATKRIIEEQITSVSKRAADKPNNNSKEPRTRLKIRQNVTENNEDVSESQLKKHTETKKLKSILKSLPKVPLKKFSKYEEDLARRASQIDKLKKRINIRRKHLLHQYQLNDELNKIADEEKRNLRRRETWEKFRENDNFPLIDQDDLIRVLMNEDDTCEDDNEEYVIPIYLSPKQYDNLLDRIYALAKTKEISHPERNKYQQFLQHLLIEDDEEVKKTPESSACNLHEYLPEVIESEQDSMEDEEISGYFDRRVFTIDPSTYQGGEPTLQLHEDYSEIPTYRKQVQSQIHDSIPKWRSENYYQTFSKLNIDEDQHQASKIQNYMKKSLVKNCHDQDNTNVLYVLNTQKKNDLPNDSTGRTRVWLQFFDRQDVNQLTKNNKLTSKLNNIYKKLEDEKAIDCAKEDATSSETTDNAKEVIRTKKSETIKLAKDVETRQNVEDDILTIENIKNDGETMNAKNVNIKIQKNKEKTHLNRNEGNIIQDKIANNIENNNKSYNLNKIKNNLNAKTADDNKAGKNAGKIIDNNSRTSKLEKEDVRSRRNIEKEVDDKYPEQQSHFLVTKTDVRNDCDRYNDLEKDSEENFNTQSLSIPLLLLPKNDKLSLNTNQFREPKNYLASSRKNFEINKDNEYNSRYIALVPTKIHPYEILKTKDYDNSLEIPARYHNILATKKTDSINQYPSNEYSEEYENLSDFSHEDAKSTSQSNEEAYTSRSEQYDYIIECNESDYESEKEDEEYRDISEDIGEHLETTNQMGFDREMLLLLPWNENKRQRRDINKQTDQVKREVQSHSNNDESNEYLNKNNIDNEENTETIEKKNTKANYLQSFSMIDEKYHDKLLEHFMKIRKKNDLHTNKISSTIDEETDLANNILGNYKKLPILMEETIPKLQDVIIDGLKEAQNLTETVEQFANNLKKFNETSASDEDQYSRNKISETTNNVFEIAIINIKKLFAELSRIFI